MVAYPKLTRKQKSLQTSCTLSHLSSLVAVQIPTIDRYNSWPVSKADTVGMLQVEKIKDYTQVPSVFFLLKTKTNHNFYAIENKQIYNIFYSTLRNICHFCIIATIQLGYCSWAAISELDLKTFSRNDELTKITSFCLWLFHKWQVKETDCGNQLTALISQCIVIKNNVYYHTDFMDFIQKVTQKCKG